MGDNAGIQPEKAVSASPVISVKVSPGSKKDRVIGKYGEGIKVQVSAPPERGKANSAVAQLLAEFFGLPVNQVELVSGPANPRKQFRLTGLSQEQVDKRLAKL